MREPFRRPDDVAPAYDERRLNASDNEYLHYINHKLGYANSLLSTIKAMLSWIAVILLALLFGLFWR